MTQNSQSGTLSGTIQSSINILKPEEWLSLINANQAGLESKMFVYSHTLGFSEATGSETFNHTEKGLSNSSLQVAAHAAGGGNGVAVEYTLVNDSATYMYVRVNDVVMFKSGITGFVTAVDKTNKKFTVTPATNVTLPEVLINEYIIISTRAYGAGSTVGEAAYTLVTKKSGQTQILKDKVATDGSARTDATWVNFGDKGFYSLQLLDGELRHLRHIEGMFVHGTETLAANAIIDATSETGAKIKTSKGLLAAAADGTSGLTSPSAYADFDAFAESFIANFVPTSAPIHTSMGFNAYKAMQAVFFDTGDLKESTSFLTKATDNKLFKASETYGVFANFKYFNQLYTYMFELNESWSDPTSFGADGFTYDNTTLMIPIYKIQDGMTGKAFGTMGTRYKSANGVNRKFMLDSFDGFGTINGKSYDEVDITKTVWLSEIGNQFMGTHQYIYAASL